jgi:hypothetical protein
MAHGIDSAANVLGTDQEDPRVVGDDAKVSDAGRPGVVPGNTGHVNGFSAPLAQRPSLSAGNRLR